MKTEIYERPLVEVDRFYVDGGFSSSIGSTDFEVDNSETFDPQN